MLYRSLIPVFIVAIMAGVLVVGSSDMGRALAADPSEHMLRVGVYEHGNLFSQYRRSNGYGEALADIREALQTARDNKDAETANQKLDQLQQARQQLREEFRQSIEPAFEQVADAANLHAVVIRVQYERANVETVNVTDRLREALGLPQPQTE